MNSNNLEMHVYFSGRVQGVSFRATARQYARQLDLKGQAINLPDGRVELIAQGPKEKLEKLIELLKGDNGPIRIDEAMIEYREPTIVFMDFKYY